jgi:hypothetical protein
MPSRGGWAVRAAFALGAAGLGTWLAMPEEGIAPPQVRPTAQERSHAPAIAAVAAAAQRPLSPFGSGPVAAEPEPAADIRERNRGIDARLLTQARPLLAETLLHELELRAEARGGFVVRDVAPGSLGERLGVRPGDLLFTFDSPENAAVDETSMVALVQQNTIALEVRRAGVTQRLSLDLREEGGDGARRP